MNDEGYEESSARVGDGAAIAPRQTSAAASDRWRDDPEPIHLWFSLSYANYLVLPRSVLQSMPQEWQAGFCTLLDGLHEAFGHLDWPHYNVQALAREPEHLDEEDCFACHGEGTLSGGELQCAECDGTGQVEADRWEEPDEVGVVSDPIPHYNRGRTKLTPHVGRRETG